MEDKEELLKRLLSSLDEDSLHELLEQTSEKKKPKGPRTSPVNPTKILDNSGFESMRQQLAKKIPLSERETQEEIDAQANRGAPPEPRAAVKIINTSCDRCGKSAKITESQMNAIIDGVKKYICPKCSLKSRS